MVPPKTKKKTKKKTLTAGWEAGLLSLDIHYIHYIRQWLLQNPDSAPLKLKLV